MPLRPKRTKNVVQTGNIADSGASTAKNRIKDRLSYRRPAFWMICAAVAAVAAWIVLLLANPVQALELPDEEEVMAVEMGQFDDRLTIGRKFITDARQIRDILSAMAGAKKTHRHSVNDNPSERNYLTIKLMLKDGSRTLYLYSRGRRWYLEEPYAGIYRTRKTPARALYRIYAGGF